MTPLHSDDLSSERVRSGWTFISELRIMRCEEHCGLWLHSLIRLDEYTYWSTRVLHLQTNSRFTEYLLLFRWHRWRWPSRTKGWQRTTRTVRSSGSDLCFILIIYRTIVIMFPVNTQSSVHTNWPADKHPDKAVDFVTFSFRRKHLYFNRW